MLYLKEFNKEDIDKEYEFFKSLKSENGFINPYSDISYDEFTTEVLKKREQYAEGDNIPEENVADTYFLLWLDDKIIGLFKVRHYLNERLANGGGHIAYAIIPEYRGNGYCTMGLSMAINKLKSMPDFIEDEIYMTCYMNNKASLQVMLNNGGYIHHNDADKYFVRIKR